MEEAAALAPEPEAALEVFALQVRFDPLEWRLVMRCWGLWRRLRIWLRRSRERGCLDMAGRLRPSTLGSAEALVATKARVAATRERNFIVAVVLMGKMRECVCF